MVRRRGCLRSVLSKPGQLIGKLFVFCLLISHSLATHPTNLISPDLSRLAQERLELLKQTNEAKGKPTYFRKLFQLGEIYWTHALALKGEESLLKEAEEKWLNLLHDKSATIAWKNRALFALGEWSFYQKRYANAIEYYDRVQSRQSVITSLKQSLARSPEIAYREQEKQENELLLKEYQNQTDLKSEAQIRKVLCLIQLKQYVQARALIEEIMPFASSHQHKWLDYQQFLISLAQGETKQAIYVFQKLEDTYNRDAIVEEAIWLLVQNSVTQKDNEKAQIYFDKLRLKFPESAYVSLAKAIVKVVPEKIEISETNFFSSEELLQKAKALQAKDFSKARSYCDQIIAKADNSMELKGEAMFLAGEIMENQREYAKAAGYFEMIEFFIGSQAGEKAIEGLRRANQLYKKAGLISDAERVYGLLMKRYPKNEFLKN